VLGLCEAWQLLGVNIHLSVSDEDSCLQQPLAVIARYSACMLAAVWSIIVSSIQSIPLASRLQYTPRGPTSDVACSLLRQWSPCGRSRRKWRPLQGEVVNAVVGCNCVKAFRRLVRPAARFTAVKR